ncbi:hypothetical protein [Paenibacillus sp. KR2-11]|uniref:hypothetical protein n=1 Tax=Paenibacillus sp. KR2-11 TaxID=3385500 RepID=UPI0038FC41E7
MSFILYLLFGFLELLSIFALMTKAFRFPFLEYIKETMLVAVIATALSYFIRVYFGFFQGLDTIAQLILYILFFRYFMKIKYWRALIVSLTYIGYVVLVLVVYGLYVSTGLIEEEVLNAPNSLSAYFIQFTSSSVAFLIAFLIYRLNLGFSFISVPPHDFLIKNKIKKHDIILLTAILMTAIVIFIGLFLLLNDKAIASIPILLVLYIILIYIAYRRDLTL